MLNVPRRVSPRPLAQHVAEENHSFGFKDSQKMPQKRLKRTEEIQSKLQNDWLVATHRVLFRTYPYVGLGDSLG